QVVRPGRDTDPGRYKSSKVQDWCSGWSERSVCNWKRSRIPQELPDLFPDELLLTTLNTNSQHNPTSQNLQDTFNLHLL
ncbi:hypothetical protein scyTo_0018591, partial [Scyliorhinus torazame]|nr:hypothetical protein [Scyliorhinus torazame]